MQAAIGLFALALGGGIPGPIVFTQSPRDAGAGSRIMLLEPGGKPRPLTEAFHSAADPEVSFDGKRILFAAKKTAADHWDIYEMNADGSAPRRITHGLKDCRSPVYQSEIFYLDDPGPLPQIAFVSDASGELNADGPEPATHLYAAKLDGTAVRRLTYNPASSFDPFPVPDGRLVFSTLYKPGRVDLLGVNKDGTDYAAFSGSQGQGVKRMGCVTAKRLVVFVESAAGARDGAGSLASISLRRNLHSYKPLIQGLFHSPSALPDGTVLVSRRRASGTHGILRFDPESRRIEPVYDDPSFDDIQAKLLAPREPPDGRSSVVDETAATAKLYCLNVFESDMEFAPGSVKRLRVLEGVPRRTGSEKLRKRFLGEIDIESDGSFHIEVPANIPIQLQALDANGMAMRTSAWIWAKNKENRGCIGCHEDGERTPDNVLAAAVAKPAIQLTLPPERRRSVDYQGEIAPILKAKCSTARCHAGAEAIARSASRLFLRDPAKRMPPAGSPQLTADEKRAIVEWIDLGAER